jgi:hypothetical protein
MDFLGPNDVIVKRRLRLRRISRRILMKILDKCLQFIYFILDKFLGNWYQLNTWNSFFLMYLDMRVEVENTHFIFLTDSLFNLN